MRSKTPFRGLFVVLSLSWACGGEPTGEPPPAGTDLDLVFCDLLQRCGCLGLDCGDLGFAGIGLEEQGAVFDPACADAWADRLPAVQCSDLLADEVPEALEFGCEQHCSVVHGSKFAGEPCQVFGALFVLGDFSDCAQGLVCDRGECKDPCVVVPPTEGQPCADGDPPCVDGLYCLRDPERPEDPGVCVGLPVAGQSCTSSQLCTQGARCDVQNPDAPVCVPLAEDGAACTGHLQCLSGHCPDGRCRPRLAQGQACSGDLRCAEGLSCFEGTCQPDTLGLCL
jgi:hypothetical protein